MASRPNVDLDALRTQMAALSGRAGHQSAGSVDERPIQLLPTPQMLSEISPRNGIARGSIVEASGARSPIVAMIAAVSRAGGYVAVVGLPQLSMLSVIEMGGDLSTIAVVADAGDDPIEIGAVLLDGMDLVVLGLDGVSVAPARAKVIAARARTQASVLVVAGGRWPGAHLRLASQVVAYHHRPTPRPGTPPAAGCGRIHGWRLQVSVDGRGQTRTREIDCIPGDSGPGIVAWTATTVDGDLNRSRRAGGMIKTCGSGRACLPANMIPVVT